MKPRCLILTVFVAVIGLAGCSSESRNVTIHAPGEYKGAQDPLLARQGQQELVDRFKLVQADR